MLITNCSNNYGPYQFPEKLIPFSLSQALEGKPIPIYGQGANIRDWIFVEDHCQGLLQVLAQGRVGETYNIGGRQEVPNLELVRRLLSLLGEMRPDLGDLNRLITLVADRPGHDWRYALNIDKIESRARLASPGGSGGGAEAHHRLVSRPCGLAGPGAVSGLPRFPEATIWDRGGGAG